MKILTYKEIADFLDVSKNIISIYLCRAEFSKDSVTIRTQNAQRESNALKCNKKNIEKLYSFLKKTIKRDKYEEFLKILE